MARKAAASARRREDDDETVVVAALPQRPDEIFERMHPPHVTNVIVHEKWDDDCSDVIDDDVVGESANANWNHAGGVSRDENVAQKRARVGVR